MGTIIEGPWTTKPSATITERESALPPAQNGPVQPWATEAQRRLHPWLMALLAVVVALFLGALALTAYGMSLPDNRYGYGKFDCQFLNEHQYRVTGDRWSNLQEWRDQKNC